MRITAFHFGAPGGPLDKNADAIFEAHEGRSIGRGTMLGTGERDIEYEVPNDNAERCFAALKSAGFRAVRRPPEAET